MGYNDTLAQMADVLATQKVTYVDAALIHWPTSTGASTEPSCQSGAPSYNATTCRLQTWRAMLSIWNSGAARSVGVSNYNVSQLQEILDAGLPLPAINQIPIHIYRSSSQVRGRGKVDAGWACRTREVGWARRRDCGDAPLGTCVNASNCIRARLAQLAG